MSTRSNIGILNSDNTVEMIYCHNDGYPSWNGKLLLEHWSDTNKVRSLLKEGDMSLLGSELGEKHDFEAYPRPNDAWCRFYRRDRGERNVDNRKVKNTAVAIKMMEEYLYLWDIKLKCWLYSDHGGSLMPLTLDDCKEGR